MKTSIAGAAVYTASSARSALRMRRSLAHAHSTEARFLILPEHFSLVPSQPHGAKPATPLKTSQTSHLPWKKMQALF